ncbi:MAG: hypothetical protein ACTTJZ_00440 [Sphaerochaetaceae bacterium]
MAVGDYFDYAHYKAMVPAAWRDSAASTGRTTYTYCCAAPAIHAEVYLKGSGWWGYQEGSLTAWYFNGTQWVQACHKYDYFRGSGQSGAFIFRHNYSGGSSQDVHDVHLWKFQMYLQNGDGGASFHLYTAGIEMIPEAIYNDYFAGRYLKALSGKKYRIGSGYDYATDSAFLEAQGYAVRNGTPIGIASDTYKFLCA